MKNILKVIKEFFQGIAIGIANVIPGFSGGTMAIIFNVYERIINAFSDVVKHPIKVIKDVWAIALGLVVGVVIAIVGVVKLLEVATIPTIMLFVGLIIGSIPFIYLSIKEYGKPKYFDYIGLIIAIAFLVVLPLVQGNVIESITFDFWLVVIVFIMGIIAAATMIIPGVSGSLVLMIFGYYFYIMGTLKDVIASVLSFNFSNLLNPIIIVISFGLGCVLGLVVISKMIKKLFELCPKTVYFVILGFLVASPFSIIYSVLQEYPNAVDNMEVWSYITSILALALGALIAGYFSMYEKKQKEKMNLIEENNEN